MQERFSVFHASQHSIEARHGLHAAADFGLSREVLAAGGLVGKLSLVRIDGFQSLLELIRNIHDETGTDVVIQRCVNNFKGTMRLARKIELAQSSEETRFISQH